MAGKDSPALDARIPRSRRSDLSQPELPLELHGHRKKLEFMQMALERFRVDTGMAPAQVRVLEVGCSNGRNVTMPLAACGYKVTGLDIHEESIEYAQAHNVFDNARFICSLLSDLPGDELFEILVLSDVLEHVEDPAGICMEALQHLAPGGMVLISIPNGFGPYELEQRFLRRTRLDRLFHETVRTIGRLLRRPSSMQGKPVGGPAYNYDSGHVQFFHLDDFLNLLEDVGLHVQQTRNGALFGGTLSINSLGRVSFIVKGSLKLADLLPQRWVSTWYFACSQRANPDNSR